MRVLWLLGLVACGTTEPTVETPAGTVGEYGPENGWFHASTDAVPSERGASFRVGELAPEVVLPDQYADDVSLYQFAGRLLVLDVFSDPGSQHEEIVEGCSG